MYEGLEKLAEMGKVAFNPRYAFERFKVKRNLYENATAYNGDPTGYMEQLGVSKKKMNKKQLSKIKKALKEIYGYNKTITEIGMAGNNKKKYMGIANKGKMPKKEDINAAIRYLAAAKLGIKPE